MVREQNGKLGWKAENYFFLNEMESVELKIAISGINSKEGLRADLT